MDVIGEVTSRITEAERRGDENALAYLAVKLKEQQVRAEEALFRVGDAVGSGAARLIPEP